MIDSELFEVVQKLLISIMDFVVLELKKNANILAMLKIISTLFGNSSFFIDGFVCLFEIEKV